MRCVLAMLLWLSLPTYAEVIQVHSVDKLVNGWYEADLSDWRIDVVEDAFSSVSLFPLVLTDPLLPPPGIYYRSAVTAIEGGLRFFSEGAPSQVYSLDLLQDRAVYSHSYVGIVDRTSFLVPEPATVVVLVAVLLGYKLRKLYIRVVGIKHLHVAGQREAHPLHAGY